MMANATGGLAVIRADAGAELGSGHIRRSLTFAEPLLRRKWRVGLAVNPEAIATVPEIGAHELIEILTLDNADIDGGARELAALAYRWPNGADLLIIDHYKRGANYEHAARQFAQRIVAIDDLADRRHDVDALIDSAPGRVAQNYKDLMDRPAHLLLGAEFALVAAAFAKARPASLARRQAAAGVRRILVSFGGTDPFGMTIKTLQVLLLIGFAGDVEAVFGLDGPNAAKARDLAAKSPFKLEVIVNATDMAARMARADLAIGAAGSSSFERCCVGLPAVVAVVAENQSAIAQGLIAAGAAVSIGQPDAPEFSRMNSVITDLLNNPPRVAQLSSKAAALVDGRGTERALDIVLEIPQRVVAR